MNNWELYYYIKCKKGGDKPIPPTPPTPETPFNYIIDNNNVTITGLKDKTLTDIEIPAKIEGASVTTIDAYAFKDCSSLTSVTIPNSVTNIRYNAFENCSSLNAITIPDSVTTIGGNTFKDCSSLNAITIPDSVTTIGVGAFVNCSSLTSIEIPNSVTSIGNYAFTHCSSLTSITIPNSVTSIGNGVFAGCDNVVLSVYKDSYAHEYAINNNIKYKIIRSVTPESAFIYSINDNSVTITGLKDKNMVGEIVVPSKIEGHSVRIIGLSAFYNCKSITSVTIPNGVTAIEHNAFTFCSALISIDIPDTVTVIDFDAFNSCTSLANVTIPNGVNALGIAVFANCNSLTDVSIPNSLTSVGSRAFQNCSNLQNVILENNFNCNNLDLSASNKYSKETIVAMLNALKDKTGETAYTLKLGSTNLSKLTDEEIAIAINKNWTLA